MDTPNPATRSLPDKDSRAAAGRSDHGRKRNSLDLLGRALCEITNEYGPSRSSRRCTDVSEASVSEPLHDPPAEYNKDAQFPASSGTLSVTGNSAKLKTIASSRHAVL